MAVLNISGKELRRVVIAASVGNIIEWYDFYIFGSLASILAVKFFGGAITYVAEHIEDKRRGYYTG